MYRLSWRSPNAGNPAGRPGTLLLLAGFAIALAVSPPVLAGNADESAEFGLVDVATGLPAGGETVLVEEDGLEYARDFGTGIASYYGARFAGRPTASGELFDPAELTAAHRSLPFGSRVLVTSEKTGRSVVVTINDRGPFHRGRIIDLSRAAADRIGLVRQGLGPVSLALLAE